MRDAAGVTVTADLRDVVADPVRPSTDRRTHLRRGWLLLVVGAWNLWLWVTRTINLFGEDRSAAFIAVHLILYGVSIAIAIVLGVLGWRMRREAQGDPTT